MHTSHLVGRHAYDPLLRLIHAWNALAIVGLVATSQIAEAVEHGVWESAVWRWHIQFGYAMIGGLVARLLWGFVGPQLARWSDLWHPRAWIALLRGHFSVPPRLGHDARASAAFLALYAVLLLMAGSGLALAAIEHNMGPLTASLGDDSGLKHFFKEPHEAGFAVVLGFIALHLGALAYHRFFLRLPVDQAMVTGTQYFPKELPHA
ncbi:MAG: cytochrome b/b6 domain-containing protein [Rhodocyclaceae bacterium]|nr:cytochrome b/b6 domain-containing protein [Rhodocyclaceae bacterium]